MQKSEMKERPKRKAAGKRTFTEDPLPAAPSKLELSPVNPKTGAAKLGQEVSIGASQGLSTPPCIKRLERKVDELGNVNAEKLKNNAMAMKKIQNQVSKLSDQNKKLQQKNSQLIAEMGTAACQAADYQLLREKNTILKTEVEQLQSSNDAQAIEIQKLKSELRIWEKNISEPDQKKQTE